MRLVGPKQTISKSLSRNRMHKQIITLSQKANNESGSFKGGTYPYTRVLHVAITNTGLLLLMF